MVPRHHRVIKLDIVCAAASDFNDGFGQEELFFAVDDEIGTLRQNRRGGNLRSQNLKLRFRGVRGGERQRGGDFDGVHCQVGVLRQLNVKRHSELVPLFEPGGFNFSSDTVQGWHGFLPGIPLFRRNVERDQIWRELLARIGLSRNSFIDHSNKLDAQGGGGSRIEQLVHRTLEQALNFAFDQR